MEPEASASADPSLPAGVHPPVGPRGHGPLVHVGYHKAASTWLQESVFCASDGAFAPIADIAASIDLLVRPHALEWSAEPVRTRLDGARAGAGAGARIPVLSNEEFSGNPHAGGFGSVEIAHRLAEVLPDARILVVVRRQPDAIVSTYKQFIRRGGTLSPRQYFDPDISHFRFRRFRPGHCEYDRLVSLYQRLFGEARVRVLPFELLRSDHDAFLGEIARFCGIPSLRASARRGENPSMSALAAAVQRRLNRIFLRDDVNPTAPFRCWRLEGWMQSVDRTLLRRLAGPAERALSARVAQLCEGRFEESNARLAVIAGLDLSRFGYALPPSGRVPPTDTSRS